MSAPSHGTSACPHCGRNQLNWHTAETHRGWLTKGHCSACGARTEKTHASDAKLYRPGSNIGEAVAW